MQERRRESVEYTYQWQPPADAEHDGRHGAKDALKKIQHVVQSGAYALTRAVLGVWPRIAVKGSPDTYDTDGTEDGHTNGYATQGSDEEDLEYPVRGAHPRGMPKSVRGKGVHDGCIIA